MQMGAKLEVSIGICAYNEAKNIGYLLQSVVEQITRDIFISEIIVVSDGSFDATNSIVEMAVKEQKGIKLIALGKRSGKYAAINAFLRAARSEVLALVSADLILDPYAIEHLCRPFLTDPGLGMTGARPLPKNSKDIFFGYLAHLLWDLHHQLALVQPKFGELVAFKKIDRDIPETLVDEEELAALVKSKDYSLLYVPASIVYNKGPMLVRDFLRQRRRIFAGHMMLKKRYGYSVATVNSARIMKCLFKKELRIYIRQTHWLIAAMFLEAIGRFLGWWDACFHKTDYLWPIAESTKELHAS